MVKPGLWSISIEIYFYGKFMAGRIRQNLSILPVNYGKS